MKLFLLFIILTGLISCDLKQGKKHFGFNKPLKTADKIINYDSSKNAISIIKKKNKPVWGYISTSEKEKISTIPVVETIIPAWIGTKWDFNGTTETPQQGNIACGYFVTTVLRDAGLPIARIKLAQCASEQMIVSLVQPKYVHRFSNFPLADFIKTIKSQGFGLYVVGLDNHTGFIYNNGNEIYFIHSTFLATRNVQKEEAAKSSILSQSKYKVLGKISADEKLLDKWMN